MPLCPVSSQTVLSVTLSLSLSFPLQIRRALLQILFADKPFSWAIHIGIAFCLLFLVNLLVILVPSIRDIFGLIGTSTRDRRRDSRCKMISSAHCVTIFSFIPQEPHLPRVSSSSYPESSTSGSSLKSRSRYCPEPRLRYSSKDILTLGCMINKIKKTYIAVVWFSATHFPHIMQCRNFL